MAINQRKSEKTKRFVEDEQRRSSDGYCGFTLYDSKELEQPKRLKELLEDGSGLGNLVEVAVVMT